MLIGCNFNVYVAYGGDVGHDLTYGLIGVAIA